MRKDERVNRHLYLFHDVAQLPLFIPCKEELADTYLRVLLEGGWRESGVEEHKQRDKEKNRIYFRQWRRNRKEYVQGLERQLAELLEGKDGS